jgi:hypothetical protein
MFDHQTILQYRNVPLVNRLRQSLSTCFALQNAQCVWKSLLIPPSSSPLLPESPLLLNKLVEPLNLVVAEAAVEPSQKLPELLDPRRLPRSWMRRCL